MLISHSPLSRCLSNALTVGITIYNNFLVVSQYCFAIFNGILQTKFYRKLRFIVSFFFSIIIRGSRFEAIDSHAELLISLELLRYW